MTEPLEVREGTTYLVTRRVTRRHFLLRPEENGLVQLLYWFFTAIVAMQTGVIVHCIQVTSNHIHEVVTDTRGNLPRFYELRNRLLANALKVHRRWPEEFFSRTSISYVELTTPEAIVDGIAYTIANCVAAFLVRTPRRWPGAKVLVEEIGRRVVTAPRPNIYLSKTTRQWPAEAQLRLEMPQALIDRYGTEDAAREAIQRALDEKIAEAHAEAKRQGRSFLGVKRVMRVPFTTRASSAEPVGVRFPRFKAAGDRAAARRVITRRRKFLADYHAARERLREGDPDVVFPYGTWKMSFCHGVRCRPPPD